MSDQQKLPYKVLKTAGQLFAGSGVGFSGRDIHEFFCFEGNHDPNNVPAIVGSNRADIFQNWLLTFPLSQQYDIIRRLCRGDVPMYHGQPSEADRNALAAMLDGLPMQEITSVIAAASISSTTIDEIWRKALDRKNSDPDGAITISRTLLESVCKHILDAGGVHYGQAEDLPSLYRLTANHLNLAPSQHSEDVFKRILGGCTSVVEGLGALRNRLGDAHGKGRGAPRPLPRHASLAVNLAGSMATFLFETMTARKAQGPHIFHPGPGSSPALGGHQS